MMRIAFLLPVFCCVVLSTTSNAAAILETAAPGGSFNSGSDISQGQFAAARFSVDERIQITRVGGNLGGNLTVADPNTLFAAIVRIGGPNAFPTDPISNAEAHAVFTVPRSLRSAELTTALSAVLDPGDYALVFGTGFFGATGRGYMPTFHPSNVDKSSQFDWFNPTRGLGSFVDLPARTDGLARRFVVEGFVIPEPGSVVLASVLILAAFAHRFRVDGSRD